MHHRVALAFALLLLSPGCDGSAPPPDAAAGTDAGLVDASPSDAGTGPADAGSPQDGGCDICDAGPPPMADYYVSPEGDDDGPGTLEAPFATLAAADAVVAPGDLVYFRGGTYREPGVIRASGEEGAPIRWEGYPGETVVFEGPGRGGTPFVEQLRVSGSWNEVRRIWVQDSSGPGIRVFGDHVWIDDVTVRRCGTTGINFFEADDGRVSDSLISLSYNQYDAEGLPADGGGADGISFAHCRRGLITGTISWGNSDDGYDLWGSFDTRIEHSYAYGNGIDRWGGEGFAGDGNGFKLGNCDSTGIESYRNVSWGHPRRGFDSNCNSMSSLQHCTSFDDRYGFNNRHATNAWTNSVALASRSGAVQTMEDEPRSNAWDLGIEVTPAHFLGTTPPELTGDESAAEALALFRASDFLRPAPGSPLVDAGEDLGEPYEGAAPDLGAFEAR
ncbi:MAG: right-handed parallel beta-helix repeat-containing protein [Sandaracinaceae bacterium]